VLGLRAIGTVGDGFGHLGTHWSFAAGLSRAQHIEADARNDGRQPSAQVVHGTGIAAVEAEPRFLDGVIRFAGRAEHTDSHGAQVVAVRFESLGQQFALVHCHSPSSRFVIVLTNPRRRT
jgi:hypothetical protein